MKDYNAITYDSKDDPGMYISECDEVNQIGIGGTREEAESELAEAVRSALEEAAEDPDIDLSGGGHSDEFNRFRKGVDFKRDPERFLEIPIYNTRLRIYDRASN